MWCSFHLHFVYSCIPWPARLFFISISFHIYVCAWVTASWLAGWPATIVSVPSSVASSPAKPVSTTTSAHVLDASRFHALTRTRVPPPTSGGTKTCIYSTCWRPVKIFSVCCLWCRGEKEKPSLSSRRVSGVRGALGGSGSRNILNETRQRITGHARVRAAVTTFYFLSYLFISSLFLSLYRCFFLSLISGTFH